MGPQKKLPPPLRYRFRPPLASVVPGDMFEKEHQHTVPWEPGYIHVVEPWNRNVGSLTNIPHEEHLRISQPPHPNISHGEPKFNKFINVVLFKH